MIRQYMSNNLHVTVADGAKEWGGEIPWKNIPYEKWMHLRIVWQASSGIKFYINNMLLSTFVSTAAIPFKSFCNLLKFTADFCFVTMI